MSSYTEPVVVITLKFNGKREGLQVLTREPPANVWEYEIVPLLSETDKPLKFIDVFVKQLDSWNLVREDGTSVPPTREGFMSMNMRFVTDVLTAWINNGILILDEQPKEDKEDSIEEEVEEDPFEGKQFQVVEMADYAPEEGENE